MTNQEKHICLRLGNVSCLPASFDKRFTRNVCQMAKEGKDLSEAQRELIYRLLYKYRKQLPKTYNLYKNHHHCCPKK